VFVSKDTTDNCCISLRLPIFGRAVSNQAGDPRITEFLTNQALGETQQFKKQNLDI
jgi:hypothetical protein